MAIPNPISDLIAFPGNLSGPLDAPPELLVRRQTSP